MTHLDTGKVQTHTGDGKGKTTAAMGLAFRATGYGLNVSMLEFVKKLHCSEHHAAARFGLPIIQANARHARRLRPANYGDGANSSLR